MSYQVADLELFFLVFCRVGGCLLLMPGFSSSRVPTHVRLFLALVVSVAVAPLIPTPAESFQLKPALACRSIAIELCAGAILGLIGRVMFAGLHFGATAAAAMMGFSPLGQAVEDDQSTDAFAEMFTLTATVMFFLLELHVEVILGLVKSYDFLPLGGRIEIQGGLSLLTATLGKSFSVSLQVVAPFVAYATLANLVFAVINKLVPQFQAYFVSVPFILGGGLLLSALVIGSGLELFFSEFTRVIAREILE